MAKANAVLTLLPSLKAGVSQNSIRLSQNWHLVKPQNLWVMDRFSKPHRFRARLNLEIGNIDGRRAEIIVVFDVRRNDDETR